MVLDEPDVIEPHLVRQDALLNGFLDDGVVIQDRSLHFVGEAKLHETPPVGAVEELEQL